MKPTKRYNPNNFNALHAAIAFLAFYVMMIAVSFVSIFLLRTFYGSGDDYASYYCWSTALIAAGIFLIVLVISLIAKVNPLNGGGYLMRKGQGTEVLMAFVLAFGLGALLSPLAETFIDSFDKLREAFGLGGDDGGFPAEKVGYLFLFSYIIVPILPAIFEELLFRGVIMRGLQQYGKTTAVIGAAFLFALAHGSYQQFIYQFLVGILCGYLAMETKNLFIGMALHCANNTFAGWGQLAYAFVGEGSSAVIYESIVQIMTVLIGTVCLVAATLYFGKRLVHSSTHPERSSKEVQATFVTIAPDGSRVEECVVWSECGTLSERRDELKKYLNGSGKEKKVHKKAGIVAPILLGIGVVIALAESVLGFLGIL